VARPRGRGTDAGPAPARAWARLARRRHACSAVALSMQQLRQPRDVHGDPSRFVLREHLRLARLSIVLALIDEGKGLPVGVANDVAARHRVGVPRCRETAGCHRGGGEPWYGLQRTGVTASGVPLPELTQPAAVSLLGFRRVYGLPRPSVTWRVTSLSRGALLIGFQL
jgi:hypothetical protein